MTPFRPAEQAPIRASAIQLPFPCRHSCRLPSRRSKKLARQVRGCRRKVGVDGFSLACTAALEKDYLRPQPDNPQSRGIVCWHQSPLLMCTRRIAENWCIKASAPLTLCEPHDRRKCYQYIVDSVNRNSTCALSEVSAPLIPFLRSSCRCLIRLIHSPHQ